ncbi:wax ester/triacylglycerol synthase domain-containing protein [Nocardia sp. NPDC088792]|uniref:wax ester/triacylglycerol synthase domain-containing protein n=1 Tax=Nocardia sp. NPDC088792 TaxID=3364332 RepID=UPI00382D951E
MNSLSPRDAAVYWLSRRSRTDLFLLYCFEETNQSTELLRAGIVKRVSGIPDLLIHVLDTPANIAYPIWAPCEFIDEQFADHGRTAATWANLEAAVGDLLAASLCANHRPWRLHVFREVSEAPGFAGDRPALVAVLQLSHALADGRRAADLARALFTGDADRSDDAGRADDAKARPTPPVRMPDVVARWSAAALALPTIPIGMARTVIRGVRAYRAQQELAELTAAAAIPAPAPTVAPNLLNGGGAAPGGHAVRMLVRDRDRLLLPDRTVTVVAATAISLALERYCAHRGVPAGELRAQVPLALAVNPVERNSYRDLSVDLAVGEPDPRRRAARIADDLTLRRERASHPLQSAQDAATAAVPAPLLHRDAIRAPIDVLPERVSGHTVISSVNRGAADLFFGGRVRFTSGFPALGAVMHLTHGVHGLGDSVTVSVHADTAIFPDLDAYVALLDTALDEVVNDEGSGRIESGRSLRERRIGDLNP